MFFARQVVLLEELSALVAFQRAAELTGVFERHPKLRRDVMLIDCAGKQNIPMYQNVLNHFGIPYIVVHDEDRGDGLKRRVIVKLRNFWSLPDGRIVVMYYDRPI